MGGVSLGLHLMTDDVTDKTYSWGSVKLRRRTDGSDGICDTGQKQQTVKIEGRKHTCNYPVKFRSYPLGILAGERPEHVHVQ